MMVAKVGLWLAVIYRIIYNIKDSYIIRIDKSAFEVIKGMHKCTILSLKSSDIDRVKIKRVYGKVYTHARSGTTSETGNTDELIIEIGNEEILVTNSLIYSHQLFVKYLAGADIYRCLSTQDICPGYIIKKRRQISTPSRSLI